MKHLTDQSLIDHAFNLLEADPAAEVARHLAACDLCRQRADRLAGRLKALDLLRDEPALTEDLVRQTLASVGRTSRVIRLQAWRAVAAAAVLAAAGVTAWVHWGTGQRPARPGPVAVDRAERRLAPSAAPASLQPPPGVQGPAAKGRQQTATGSEPPPFAPASAIELVTLPRRESVQLTIYNPADLTLVRDRRSLTLKRGWNWLQFMWANTLIDPTSLDLEPRENKDAIRVEQLVYPAGLKDIGRWLIWSEVEGQVPFEITYFTSGVSWRAFYEGILSTDTRSMDLKGYVRVTNHSGEDYEDAQVRLIVGQVHLLDPIADLAGRPYPHGCPVPTIQSHGWLEHEKLDAGKDGDDSHQVTFWWAEKQKQIVKEGLSEYFLYTIEGTETIPTGWSKRLVSLEANDVPVVSLYKYEKARYGDAVVRFLSFRNDQEHRLGQTPVPEGQWKVYRAVDDQGHLSFIGGAELKYIPVGQDAELDLGEARDVVVEPSLMDFRTEQHRFDNNRDLSGWDEVRTFRFEVRNASSVPAEVEIRQGLQTTYWDLTRADAVGTYEKVDADTFKFNLDVEGRAGRSFEYRLRTYHGTREQDWK